MADAPLTPQTLRELAQSKRAHADHIGTAFKFSAKDLRADADVLEQAADLWSQSLSTGSRVEQEKEHFCGRCHHRWTGEGSVEYCGDCHRGSASIEPRRDERWQAAIRAILSGDDYRGDAFVAMVDAVMAPFLTAVTQRCADLESQLLATTQERDRLQIANDLLHARILQLEAAPGSYSATVDVTQPSTLLPSNCQPELGIHFWPNAHGCLCGAQTGVNQ